MSSFAPRSFFLQKADGRFYPDFLCQLPDKNNEPGRILAVEYERADRWVAAEDDRLIGCLWEPVYQSSLKIRVAMTMPRRDISVQALALQHFADQGH